MTAPVGSGWPGARALATEPANPYLDLDAGVAQRSATFRFALSDGVTGENLGDITPIRPASLRHDASQTIKRQLDFALGVADTAAVNPVRDRINVFMVIPGVPCPFTTHGDWPMGRYMWADDATSVSTGGARSQPQLTDEMFLVDQAILKGISGFGRNVIDVALDIVAGLPIDTDFEPCPFTSSNAWGVGAHRGQMLETLSISGDYWSPWFDNLGVLRFRRTFDPARQVPDVNLDIGARVLRAGIIDTNNLLTAPNTFVVISNVPSSTGDPVVGTATIPPSAPNSVFNRGFAITQVLDLQLTDGTQAAAVAQGLAERNGAFEQVSLSTAPDPRHDSYQVIRWQGVNWVELAWGLQLVEGAPMTHRMRRSYGPG